MWCRFARSPQAASRSCRLVRAAVAVCALATVVVATEWRSSISLIRRNGNLLTRLATATASPPSTALLPKPRLTGLVEYLRRCTRPEDRVFAAWFVPELYFFTGRAFSGGMVETFGDHWSEPDHQRRIVEKMKTESVPIVLVREGDESFRRGYPVVAEYLSARYQAVGSSAFGAVDGGNYTVFTRTDRVPSGTDRSPRCRASAGAPDAHRKELLENLPGIAIALVAGLHKAILLGSAGNDDYQHLAYARQILAGDLPLRDFWDISTTLQDVLSAASQLVFGHRLLAEAIIVGLATATAVFRCFASSAR